MRPQLTGDRNEVSNFLIIQCQVSQDTVHQKILKLVSFLKYC